jgi:Fe-S cluster assembly iron-binding protein IscA
LGLALDEPQDDDQQLQVNGVTVLMRPDEAGWLDDAQVDYHLEEWRKGFSVTRGGEAGCC